jgi:hypothetical protein
MPGLTDAHVHIGAVDVNILEQLRQHPTRLAALKMARILEATLVQAYITCGTRARTEVSSLPSSKACSQALACSLATTS